MAPSLAEMNKLRETSAGASDFVAVARAMMHAAKSQTSLRSMADEPGLSPRARDLLKNPSLPLAMKGAFSGISSHDFGADTGSLNQLAAAFLESVGLFSVFERINADRAFVSLPARPNVAIRVLSSQPTADEVGEGTPMPVVTARVDVQDLTPVKITSVVIVNDEVFKLDPNISSSLLGAELRRAVGLASDTKFLSLIGVGATTITSSGLTGTAMLSDLDAALQAIQIGSGSRVYLIVGPAAAKTLSIANSSGLACFSGMSPSGGSISGIRTLVSEAAGSDGYLVAAEQIAVADGGITLDTSIEAAVQPDDSPTASSPVLSLFQHNLTGLRAVRYLAVSPLRQTAVVKIASMDATTA